MKLSDIGAVPPPPQSGVPLVQPGKPQKPLRLSDVQTDHSNAPKPAAPDATPKEQLTPGEMNDAENLETFKGIPGGTYVDEMMSAADAVKGWAQGKGLGASYDASQKKISHNQSIYESEHPTASTLRALGGAALTTPVTAGAFAASKLPMIGRSAVGALTGGIGGAAQSFGEGGSFDERKKNAMEGGAFGTVLGMIFPPLGAIARSAVGKAAMGTAGGAAVGAYEDPAHPIEGAEMGGAAGLAIGAGANRLGGGSASEWSENFLKRAFKSDSVTKEQALKTLAHKDASLSELGETSVISAAEQAALSGEGRRLGSSLYYKTHMEGREANMSKAVDHLISDQSMYETLDKLSDGQATAAAPLYKAAFDNPKNMAPFTEKLQDSFNETSKHFAETYGAVDDAERELTMAEAKLHRAGDNVYGVSSAKSEVKSAEQKLEEAKAAHQEAADRKDSIHGQLRQAQSDAETGTKAIWSPRIESMLQNHNVGPGLKTGLRILRNEADARGTKFDPNDFAIKGNDANGDPIVGETPSLRMLDAIKVGIDHIIEEHRDNFGKLDREGRSIQEFRSAFVKELDANAPPEYRAARKAYEGPARMKDAVFDGKDFMKKPPELITKEMARLSPAEKDAYRIGVARAVSDVITGGGTGALSMAKRISGSTAMKDRLRAALQDDDAYDRLIELADREVKLSQRGSQIIGGSPTARRSEGGKEFEHVAPVIDDMISGARTGLVGIAAGAKQQIGRAGARWIGDALLGMSQARRDTLAKLLFSTDKEQNMKAIEMLFDERGMTVPNRYRSMAITPAITGASALTSQNSQQPQP